MNKKQIIAVGLCTVLGAGVVLTARVTQNSLKLTNAEECTHPDVRHYAGVGGYDITLEHWACCVCHEAWADEARTINIANTEDDRDNLEHYTDITVTTQWDVKRSIPVYDQYRGYVYKNMCQNLEKDAYNAIEVSGDQFDDTNQGWYIGEVTNNTSAVIRVDVMSRAWNYKYSEIYVGVGETKSFEVSAMEWDQDPSGDNYGFTLICRNCEVIAEGDYITLTPLLLTDRKSSLTINSNLNGWAAFTSKANNDLYGEITVCNITDATTAVVWNGASSDSYAGRFYAKVCMGVYNPTENTIDNIRFVSANSGWDTLETSPAYTLVPGWNRINFPASMFEHKTMSMIALNLSSSQAALMADVEWAFSAMFGVRISYYDYTEDLVFNSNLNDWAAFTDKSSNKYDDMVFTDCLLTSDVRNLIWNNPANFADRDFERVALMIIKPNDGELTLTLNACDKDWGTLENQTFTIKNGHNFVFFKASLFEHSETKYLTINVNEETASSMVSSSYWGFSNFVGVR